jgi:hypothetical protein
MSKKVESPRKNEMWELVKSPKGHTIVGYKCVFKTTE